MSKPRCLITGATGLIGSHLVEHLKEIYELFVFSHRPFLAAGCTVIEGDLGDTGFSKKFPMNMDKVVHLAQSNHFRDFPDRARTIFDVNVAAVLELLGYARKAGVRSFVLASTGGVYGNHEAPVQDKEPLVLREGLGFYASSRLAAEILADNYTPYFDIQTLRFFFVYGPEQKEGMLIPRLVRSVEEGMPVKLQGEGGLVINPIFVSDAVGAIEQALKIKGSHKINVAGAEELSLQDIGLIIGELVGKEPLFETQKRKAPRLVADISRMQELLVSPTVPFKEGISKLCHPAVV